MGGPLFKKALLISIWHKLQLNEAERVNKISTVTIFATRENVLARIVNIFLLATNLSNKVNFITIHNAIWFILDMINPFTFNGVTT